MRFYMIAVFMFLCSHATAAELEVNPPLQLQASGAELLSIDAAYRGGIEFARSMEGQDRARTVEEQWGWVFENGIQSDGAHTYQTLHMPTAWDGLSSHPVISLTGTIVEGDAARLEALIASERLSNCISPGYCPFAPVLQLNSLGGNFGEALLLTEIVQRENLITFVPPDGDCLSACTLVFLAGFTTYEGYFFPRRFAHTTARIGFHQPSFTIPQGQFDAQQVQAVTDVLTDVVNRAAAFFVESGVSLNLLSTMYRTPADDMQLLTPIWGASEGIFYYDDTQAYVGMRADRAQVLAYCAEVYRAEFGGHSQALIDTLQVSETAFISFETGSNYACAGVRRENTWHVCRGWCEFGRLGQAQATPEMIDHAHWNVLDYIMVGVDNAELGIVIRDVAHRGGLLTYVRMSDETTGRFTPVPLDRAQIELPSWYCGRLDNAHPDLVRAVQTRLNAIGIDVGRPDGSPGENTRLGIIAATERLLGHSGTDGVITAELVRALGADADAPSGIGTWTFCDPGYLIQS